MLESIDNPKDLLIYALLITEYFHFFDSQDNNSFSAISSRSVNIHDASENLNNSCKKLLQAEEDAKNERIR